MKINCGDVCRIVHSHAGNDGKIVIAVRPIGPANFPFSGEVPEAWLVDPPLPSLYEDGSESWTRAIAAFKLRPIRDQPGADETLTWKAVPSPSLMSPKKQLENTR